LSYALAKGTGYLYEDWDPSMWGPGRGDIRLRAFDPADISFVQIPKSHDIQQAYVVLIREEWPLALAKRMFGWNPQFANSLRADREQPGMIDKGLNYVQQFIAPFLRSAGSAKKENYVYPTCFVWNAYTLDGSINDTGEPLKMGARGTNWAYTVPYLGQDLPQALVNPQTGQRFTLPASPDDCLLFPLRRLTVFSRTGIAYDGSSSWWHGDVPLARISFNDLPWEALGASQIGDGITMQEGIIATMRAVEDSIAARLDPPVLYDDTRVDKTFAEAFNTRKAGTRAGADLTQGSPLEYPVPPNQYDVPAYIIGEGGYIRQQEDRIDKITSVRDLVAIAKARQIPSSDTLEKLLEMSGPIVQDMVQALVKPLTQLGNWRKAYYLQFYTKGRMIQIADPSADELRANVQYASEKLPTGPDGQPVGVYPPSTINVKYSPDQLIPKEVQQAENPMNEAVRTCLGDYRYEVTESGLSEFNRMTQTLLYIQLSKAGFPISWWTIAKAARIPNFGPPPANTNTEMERWTAQKNMEAEMQVELAQKIQEATGGGAPPGPDGGGEGAGRPPSFNKPPRLVNKPNEGRSVIATS
jgi:hypothetical protein